MEVKRFFVRSNTKPQEDAHSVELENVDQQSKIGRDSFSRISFSSILHSASNLQFSVNLKDNDDTTSFYTAFDDFPNSSATCNQVSSGESMWTCRDIEDITEPVAEISHFEIFWFNLTYIIKQKLNLRDLFTDFIDRALSCIPNSLKSSRSGEYTVKRQPISIFQNICGSVKSGQLTGIVGPSGAGKTSLLNCLSRKRSEGYSGLIEVSPQNERKLKICVIPQHDTLLEHLTVKENLSFASRIKNVQKNFNHEQNISQVSKLLGIDECLNTKTAKLSGGQKKRLSIGQELLSNPDILIMDEPTSGLDSLTCYRTICILRDIVKLSARRLIKPIAIIVTIHQPQQEVFELFDKIYAIATGGTQIYNGSPINCMQFIESHSGLRTPDSLYNPASFLIEIASGEYGTGPIDSLSRKVNEEFKNIKNLNNISLTNDNYRIGKKGNEKRGKSSAARPLSLHLETTSLSHAFETETGHIEPAILAPLNSLKIDDRLSQGSPIRKDSFWFKTGLLIKRSWVSYRRDPVQLYVRLLFHIVCPLGIVYLFSKDTGAENACPQFKAEIDINNLLNEEDPKFSSQEAMLLTLENLSFYFILNYSIICATVGNATLMSVMSMEGVFKEIHNGWYSVPSYLLARTVADLPIEVSMPILTNCIAYPLSGQPASVYEWRLMIVCFAAVVGCMSGQTIGLIFGTLFRKQMQTALFIAQGASLPGIILSGYCVRTKQMTKFLQILSYTSIYRAMIETMTIVRYGFGSCGECDETKLNGGRVEMTGVSEKLKSFSSFWLSSSSDDSGGDGTSSMRNGTRTEDDRDLFQLFAQEITLSKSYGMEIKTCNDIQPYELYELTLRDSDLPIKIIHSIILLIVLKVSYFVLFSVITRKSSL